MNKLLTTITLLFFSSCESTVGSSFEEMSEIEIAAYNASVLVDEKVVCQEAYADWIGGSYRQIPKICATVREIKRQQRQAEANAASGYSGRGADMPSVVC